MAATRAGSFGDDLAFIRAHGAVVVLASEDGRAQVAVSPEYQGRVMTSTAAGPDGASFGYVHRAGIEAGRPQPHMSVVGGEDRFWVGPEGGQYALYFPPGAAFDTEHWQVPAAIDWGAWPVASQGPRDVSFTKTMTLRNYAGTSFDVRVDRLVRLLDRPALVEALGVEPGPGTSVVAYESDNRITNTGSAAWRKETGLMSIWILGMLRPAPRTTVVIPYEPGSVEERGPVVNDKYFGAPPASRLKIGERAILFRGDGRARGKIGVPRPRARNVAGSYDPDGRLLTLIQFSLPDAPAGYVNSMWALQQDPYGGDVINSYNDGPLGPGQPPLGPFYEIESSSPAAALRPGASMSHRHRTLHLQGPPSELDIIARKVLGVGLDDIAGSLPE
ncbi:MAG: hypothetical protein IT184_11610 [Acidobacteria bacterium]|nr:hypothetical protein [Acidobacteriota bacterium]